MSQDGRINRFCAEHKEPEVVATRRAHCEVTPRAILLLMLYPYDVIPRFHGKKIQTWLLWYVALGEKARVVV